MAIALGRKEHFAIYFFNEEEKIYTVTSLGKGGPIIMADSLEGAKKEFETALNLAASVNNLLFFKDAKFKANPVGRNNLRSASNHEITYIPAAA